MIELIRTYTGHPRAAGQVKMTVTAMYRCTKCETIKPTFKELKEIGCTKNEHHPSIQK